MADIVAYAGKLFSIEFARLRNGSIPALEFLNDQKPQHRARILYLFKLLGDHGRISNDEHFKKFRGDFWEFKNFQIRLFCYFRPGKRVVVTHGFIKKKNATNQAEFDRAISIKAEYEGI